MKSLVSLYVSIISIKNLLLSIAFVAFFSNNPNNNNNNDDNPLISPSSNLRPPATSLHSSLLSSLLLSQGRRSDVRPAAASEAGRRGEDDGDGERRSGVKGPSSSPRLWSGFLRWFSCGFSPQFCPHTHLMFLFIVLICCRVSVVKQTDAKIDSFVLSGRLLSSLFIYFKGFL